MITFHNNIFPLNCFLVLCYCCYHYFCCCCFFLMHFSHNVSFRYKIHFVYFLVSQIKFPIARKLINCYWLRKGGQKYLSDISYTYYSDKNNGRLKLPFCFYVLAISFNTFLLPCCSTIYWNPFFVERIFCAVICIGRTIIKLILSWTTMNKTFPPINKQLQKLYTFHFISV